LRTLAKNSSIPRVAEISIPSSNIGKNDKVNIVAGIVNGKTPRALRVGIKTAAVLWHWRYNKGKLRSVFI